MTLIELMIVLFILGILFSIMAVRVGGLTPVYRVRSASRSVASMIEELRALAIATGKPMGIRYTFHDDPHFYQLIPPAPDEYPDEPIENRRLGVTSELPPGVQFRHVLFPGGRGVKAPGAVNILFSPMGNSGSHVVALEGRTRDGQPILISVKFNAITGAIDFAQGEAGFEDYES